MRIRIVVVTGLILVVAPAACGSPRQQAVSAPVAATTSVSVGATPSPTPTQANAGADTTIERYTVRNGDTLSGISQSYNVPVEDIQKLNGLADPKMLKSGQVLKIPIPITHSAPDNWLLPDSEVVDGPAYASFDIAAIASQYKGYLTTYQERVEGDLLTGPQVIQLVAERFSVGPRVLLALLEYQGNWITKATVSPSQISYPMGLVDSTRLGLFLQTSWAAGRLKEGYYGRLSGQFAVFAFKDHSRGHIFPAVNPGTAAVQNVLALTSTWDQWRNGIGPDGFMSTYSALFGDPAVLAIESIVPKGLKQPALRLPWSDGERWYFTGGPHAGWGDFSALSALDFSPGDTVGSCVPSRRWDVAAAPGKVLRTEHGRVVISLNDSNFQGSGWALLYMHVATAGRVNAGTQVNTGDHIGHPSCEGGDAQPAHLHFARLYNGQWIDTAMVPMVLSGWAITSLGQAYEGKMTRGSETRAACNCRDDTKNGIVGDDGSANP